MKGIIIFFYVCITLFSLYKALMAIQGTLNHKRGTNAASRFVRDVAAGHKMRRAYVWGTIQALNGLVCILCLGLSFWTLLMPLPGIGVIGLSAYLQYQSNNDKQRIKDARVVTKTGTKVAKAAGTGVAVTAGVAATVATGGAAGVALGAGIAAAGVGASRVAGKSGEMMTDVDAPDITEEDFKELNNFGRALGKLHGIDIDNPGQFVLDANKIGIPGATLEEIGQNALQQPVMRTLLAENNQEATVENVLPLVQRTIESMK